MNSSSRCTSQLSMLLNRAKPNVVERIEKVSINRKQGEPVVACRMLIYHMIPKMPNPADITFSGIKYPFDDPEIGYTENGFVFQCRKEGRILTVAGFRS